MTNEELTILTAKQGTRIIRLRLALKVIHEFCGFGHGYSPTVTLVMTKWMEDGMDDPVPWVDGAFFREWAESQGLSNIDGHVGYRFTGQLMNPMPPGEGLDGEDHW